MMNPTEKSFDQKVLIDIMLQAYERGQASNSLEPKDIIEDIASRLRPFFHQIMNGNGQDHEQTNRRIT